MTHNPRNSEAGMSLLEIMFAAAVIGTAMAMMFGSLMTINQVGEVSEDQMRAAVEMDKIFEELRSLSQEDLLAYQAPQIANGPGKVTVAVALAYDEAGYAHWLPASSQETPGALELPNPAEIRVLVVWIDDSGRTMDLDASTYVEF